ncbi:MFS transporter permease [Phytopseudomonas dryadis]|uniref:MFS transporter permease n=1 Tax=Phytopseudomonas dryadis TaxID=2487520 RepID=A0A4Q9QW34_9GAMM|nr:MFS transporter permease [Pseudomonas dryadis]TBU88309.1 MFS transporter permease [Pseudomonas dryadis]
MDNLYRTPSADLLVNERPAATTFFVTSTAKLYLMFFLTLGLYSIYWFYKQWDTQRVAMRPKKISPAARSLFNIFFVHSLCARIREQLQARGLDEWKYGLVAWLYILTILGSNALSRVDGQVGEMLELMLLAASVILPAWPLAVIQEKANQASGDPQGASNARLSLQNLLCATPGALLWLLIVVGSLL